jgi:3-oxoacyl-[acyl-carrier protein] reductase
VHILVNNTGGPPAGYFEDLNDDDWYNAFNLTFMSAMRFIREVAPFMKRQRWGRIINITSMSVKQPIDNLILSNTIRLAVIGMSKTLALQWAKYGITINNIAPGPIYTERIKELSQARADRDGITYEDALRAWLEEVPMKRFGEPEEVAYLAAFLASDKAGFITGTTIQIDGGAIKFVL